MAVEKHRMGMWSYDSYFLIGFLPANFTDIFQNIRPRVHAQLVCQAGEIPASLLIALLYALPLDGNDNYFPVVRIQEEAYLGDIAAVGAVRMFF